MAYESAIVVLVPEADGLIERVRGAGGIPAHVTLLYPFAPPEAIDEALLAALTEVLSRHRAFELTLERMGRLPGVVYLEPDPPEPFVRLIEALVARFPEYPPYGGVFDHILPHLTVVEEDDLAAAEAAAAEPPIRTTVRDVAVLEELERPWAEWRLRTRLPLAG